MSVPPRASVESTVVVVLASRIDGPVRSPMVTSWQVVGSVATTVAAPAVPAGAGAAEDVSDPRAFATSKGVLKPTVEVPPIIASCKPPFNPVKRFVSPVTAYWLPIAVVAPWNPSVPVLFAVSFPRLLEISAAICVAVLPSNFAVSDR